MGFLVSKFLTLPSAPIWREGLIDNYVSVSQKKGIRFSYASANQTWHWKWTSGCVNAKRDSLRGAELGKLQAQVGGDVSKVDGLNENHF